MEVQILFLSSKPEQSHCEEQGRRPKNGVEKLSKSAREVQALINRGAERLPGGNSSRRVSHPSKVKDKSILQRQSLRE